MGVLRDRLDRALSPLEMLMAGAVVLALGYALGARLEALLASVESAKLRAAVSQIDTALRLDAARYLMTGDEAKLALLDGANPFAGGTTDEQGSSALTQAARRIVGDPDNYLGALSAPDPGAVPGGRWYFDARAGLVVYRVEHEDYFVSALPGPKRARFRVVVEYVDGDGDRRFSPGADTFKSVRLVPAESYAWR